MPCKVAPFSGGHPHPLTMAVPRPTAAATGSYSEQASPFQSTLCTFIDAALNICSFDTTNTHDNGTMAMSPTQGECSVQDDDERGQPRYKQQNQQQQQQLAPRQTTQFKLDTSSSSRPMSNNSYGSSGGGSQSSSPFRRATTSSSNSSQSDLLRLRQETVILPHLRFNAFQSSSTTSSSSSSSLQEFYALFLADNAPHSFRLFHESYGDENVVVTPWKTKERSTNNNNTICEEDDDECRGLDGTTSQQRTITYQTKISPGSSSNPLLSTTAVPSNASTSNNIIPLGVTIVQTLVRNSNKKTWVLHCEFSFDFQNSSSPPTASGSSSIASSTNHNNNNNSNSGSISSGVGKKLLGAGGLSQYFMSNVIKGSTVNVSILMKECDEGAEGAENWHHASGTSASINRVRAVRGTTAASSRESCQENIFSCFSHPLLLPPDGLCGSGSARGAGSSSGWRTCNSNCIITEEPSKIGASLLSAIKAKNASSATDFSSSNKTIADVSLAASPLASNPEGGIPSEPNTTSVMRLGTQQQRQDREEDVLAYCSSRGSMKVKNIPSELSRAPSTISMRRMILDKTETIAASGSLNHDISWNSEGIAKSRCTADTIQAHDGSLSSSTPSSQFTRGISMRIQMELVDSSATHPPSTLPFSRSPSIPTIDDKIRRGLKKRFARSWVSWAESWCMRVWEEEEAERLRKRALGMAIMPDSNKRNKVNVRPNVRRIGDPEGTKKANDQLSPPKEDTATSSSSVSTKDDDWKVMHVNGSPTRKNERWISREGREEECGVEVECTVAIQQPQQERRLKVVDINQNKELGIGKSTVKRHRLLI